MNRTIAEDREFILALLGQEDSMDNEDATYVIDNELEWIDLEHIGMLKTMRG